MEAKLKMRLEYEQPFSYSSQSPFINVLPNEPSQAYKRMDYTKLEAIKKTQKIPFSSIRELILAYLLPNQEIMDTQQSDLFKQKLSDDKYQKDHAAVNKMYDELAKEKARLAKLYEVTHKYIERRQKLVSNQLRRTIHRRYDSSQLGNLLQGLEQKKQNELKILQRKIDESSKSMIKVDSSKEKMQIQQGYNREVLKLFEQQLPKLQKLSQEFHQIFQNVNWFRLFIEDFQKSIVFIMSARKISNKPNKRAEERLLKDSFYVQLKATIHQLDRYLNQSLQSLFNWRMSLKYGRANLQQPEVHRKYNEQMQNICQSVYNLLPQIISILKADKETIKMVESQIAKQYSTFLPGYYDAKEVALFYKKQSKIEQILQNQKQLLIDHLKKNYSMMVYYTKSADYMGSIEQYKSKNKGYLRDILNKKIVVLDVAVNFINKQYGQLYKQACDGKYGVRDKILSKCRSLQGSLSQNQTILSLLLQSCRRLLNIASK